MCVCVCTYIGSGPRVVEVGTAYTYIGCMYIHRVWTTLRSGYSVHIHRVYVHT